MSIGLSPRSQAIWEKAQKLENFTTNDIAAMGVSQGTARRYCDKWQRKGLLRLIKTVGGNSRLYAPIKQPISEANMGTTNDKGATPEGNMWRTMNQLPEFTPTDVAAHSNVGTVSIDVKAAQTYCRALLGAGYLRVRVKARPGLREAVYRLINKTGPRPPVLKRVMGVFDPNTEEFIPNTKEGSAWQRS